MRVCGCSNGRTVLKKKKKSESLLRLQLKKGERRDGLRCDSFSRAPGSPHTRNGLGKFPLFCRLEFGGILIPEALTDWRSFLVPVILGIN